MESQTRRVEEWLKETVVPAEGGREHSLSWLPFLRFIQLEKVTMGCGDDNGFRRTDIWNRTSVGGASFMRIHRGRVRDGRTAGYDMMDRGNCDCG